ncbi:acetyltransferase [Halalkalibacter wakoensis JCM 9140]|uniref:Acetyltransferase n=1 Tax=Halalkalibacter wakoensis JCM 9140 TaxID=1236970 RepID=W4PYS6_9BACI|nr:GNAT family N-acetyltransferase [Halalkalibacter wakoensis]GAE24961.1 acetyltransferase [Halalkalibacter wakoensis JCM 9140]
MKINTKRLTLIPCTNESLSSIESHYPIGPHIESYVNDLEQNESLLGWGVWFVIAQENVVIGDIGFKGKPDSKKSVEIGYGIIEEAQNKGFATEAVQNLIQWAFAFEEVEIVKAECLEDNIASIKVLEKLGMKKVNQQDNMLEWELVKPR